MACILGGMEDVMDRDAQCQAHCEHDSTTEAPVGMLWGGEGGGGGRGDLPASPPPPNAQRVLAGVGAGDRAQAGGPGFQSCLPLGRVAWGHLPFPRTIFYEMDVTAPTQGTVVRIK